MGRLVSQVPEPLSGAPDQKVKAALRRFRLTPPAEKGEETGRAATAHGAERTGHLPPPSSQHPSPGLAKQSRPSKQQGREEKFNVETSHQTAPSSLRHQAPQTVRQKGCQIYLHRPSLTSFNTSQRL